MAWEAAQPPPLLRHAAPAPLRSPPVSDKAPAIHHICPLQVATEAETACINAACCGTPDYWSWLWAKMITYGKTRGCDSFACMRRLHVKAKTQLYTWQAWFHVEAQALGFKIVRSDAAVIEQTLRHRRRLWGLFGQADLSSCTHLQIVSDDNAT
ncbi:hypothetical protein LZ30DRAFT_689399 [Colletotrichum cereale]|nr:hypothetical protein LZ30DRAFT_689399 [Colletotrichum cereale]